MVITSRPTKPHEEWATTEGNLQRLLGSKICALHGRTPSSRLWAIYLYILYILFIPPKQHCYDLANCQEKRFQLSQTQKAGQFDLRGSDFFSDIYHPSISISFLPKQPHALGVPTKWQEKGVARKTKSIRRPEMSKEPVLFLHRLGKSNYDLSWPFYK